MEYIHNDFDVESVHNYFTLGKQKHKLRVPKELFLGMNAIETQDYSDQISKIFSIYQSNSFDDGVGIQRQGFVK